MELWITRGVLVLADGETFEGVAVGHRPDDGGRAGRGRVQHRARRLPGDRHRPVVRGPDHHVHVPAHRQLRRQRRRRRGARAALPGRDRARPRAAAVELARDRRPRRLPRAPRGRRASPASTPAGSRATSAARRDARRVRHRRPRHAARGRAGRRRHRRPRPRRRGHHAGAVHRRARRREPATSSRTTSASSARSSTSSSQRGLPGRGRARVDAARPTCSRASPTACSSRTVPAIPRRSTTRATSVARAARQACRCSASASGTRSCRLALGAATFKLRVRSSRRQPSGAQPRDRPGRDHEPEPQLRGRRAVAARRQRS